MKDLDRKQYDSAINVPYNSLQEPGGPETFGNHYNQFVPFPAKYIKPEERHVRAFSDLKRLTKYMCQNPVEQQFIIKFLAHLIQKPAENPQTIICFKGVRQGVGKDTIISTIRAMIGSDKVSSTSDMGDVFGSWNSTTIAGKLVVNFNEAEGLQGSKFNNQLKDATTRELNLVKQKYCCERYEKNYIRFLVSSNNFNPIVEGRRTFICQTRLCERVEDEETDFFINYNQGLNDDRWVNTVFSYLMDMDISKFDPKKPPKSSVEKRMADQRIRPIHRFFQDIGEGSLLQAEGDHCFQHPNLKTSQWCIKPRKFKELYENWLMEKNEYKHNETKKSIMGQLDNWVNEFIGAIEVKKTMRHNNKQHRVWIVDKEKVIVGLQNCSKYSVNDVD